MPVGQSHAAILTSARLVVNGINLNLERMEKRGITAERVAALSTLVEKGTALDADQEVLKAKLKEKTSEMEATLDAITEILAEFRKLIKVEMPQESWREFGIDDKH